MNMEPDYSKPSASKEPEVSRNCEYYFKKNFDSFTDVV
jgi:hypothetical protein